MKKQTYESAIKEIEEIVAHLEDNTLNVDELGENVKRVSELLAFCKEKLHATESEVENILKSMDEGKDEKE